MLRGMSVNPTNADIDRCFLYVGLGAIRRHVAKALCATYGDGLTDGWI